jgi:hypothetical protein
MLASLLYPYDDDAPKLVDTWLLELERAELIKRYDVGGDRYLELVNWLKHQKIDRPSKSRLPSFVEGSRVVVEPSTTDLGYGPRTKDMDLSAAPMAREVELDLEPADERPKDKLFRVGKTVLVSLGLSEERSGAVIGTWLKKKNEPVGILAAIEYARDHCAVDPIGYVTRILQDGGGQHGKKDVDNTIRELADKSRELERQAGVGR